MRYNNDGAGLVGCLVVLLWVAMIFVGPLMVYLGWEAVSYEFNLPTFSFWQCFFISNGIRYLLGGFNSTTVKTN